jgi:hypothetical protein
MTGFNQTCAKNTFFPFENREALMGRQKKTIAELKKSGTYRPSRHGRPSLQAVQPPDFASKFAPEGLGEDESNIWQQLVECLPRGSLELSDRFAFRSLVRLIAKEQFHADKFTAGDMNALIRLYSKFALTPVDRAKAPAPPEPMTLEWLATEKYLMRGKSR